MGAGTGMPGIIKASAPTEGTAPPAGPLSGESPATSKLGGEDDDTNLIERFWGAASRGAREGWNPDDPVGFDPDVKQAHAALLKQYPLLAALIPLNNTIAYPAVALADTVLRGSNAALHAGAALAGQTADETGLGGGQQLEHDLLGMLEMAMGSAGRLRGAAAQGRYAGARAAEEASKGRFVKSADGSVDLGRVGPEVEAASEGRFPQAPIRMQQGLSGKEGFGARHISPDKHVRAQNLGYRNGHDLIEDVAKNHNVVLEQVNGRLMLVLKEGQNRYAIAEYRKDKGWKSLFGKDAPYYGITTGYPDSEKNVGKARNELDKALKKPGNKKLWEE